MRLSKWIVGLLGAGALIAVPLSLAQGRAEGPEVLTAQATVTPPAQTTRPPPAQGAPAAETPAPPAAAARTSGPRAGTGAVLRVLDKITGRARDVTTGLNRPLTFETLSIVVRSCRKAPPEDRPEVWAFLEITDTTAPTEGGERPMLFSGWMFASSPALNALEHPNYDVWVIDCRS